MLHSNWTFAEFAFASHCRRYAKSYRRPRSPSRNLTRVHCLKKLKSYTASRNRKKTLSLGANGARKIPGI